jgi:hypothetical protein
VRESATLPAVTLWWSTWVAEPPRERERVALGEGGRVYGEGRRDIRDLWKVKKGSKIRTWNFFSQNS